MKKVGIITYYHYYNYGTVLQAYALQNVIERMGGYSVELIDFRASGEKKSIWGRLCLLPVYIKEWQRVLTLIRYGKILSKKKPFFENFFVEDLKTSHQTYQTFKALQENSPNYDIMVTGSDQVWSPLLQIGLHPAMFLEFGLRKALRIAYAPSVGVSHFSKEESAFFNVHLQPYEALSCRERVGTDLLRNSVKGKNVINVIDPTLLLTESDWNEIAITSQIKKPYILCYFIGHKTYYRDVANRLSQKMQLPLYYIPMSWRDLKKNNLISDVGPKEFLGLIRDARLVLTDSFHGTAFSINFRKSFYSFTKIKGGKEASDNSRLYDILSKYHLEDRLYDTALDINFSDIDYTEVDKRLEEDRQKSLCFLKDSMIDKRICAYEECTGCMACKTACVHHAINIEKDLMGFFYPKKIMDLCVDCGLCEDVCPNNNKLTFHYIKESYVATAKESQEVEKSASGGIASIIARFIIRNGGVVYGCTSMDAAHIQHIRISRENEIDLIKGSKYVQSDTILIMDSIKDDLKNGLTVLFIGTPCQVAGLQSFLRKPYKNLLTVDFVCHGVPSQQLFNDILGNDFPMLGKIPLKVDFRFRDKRGRSKYGIKLSDNNGKCVFKEIYPNNRYITGYLDGMFYRECCYQCHYAKSERVSDITLGDYWDREEKYTVLRHHKVDGLSMMMINTPKGEFVKKSIQNSVKMVGVATEILPNRNSQLIHPMQYHLDYETFKYEYMNYGYSNRAVMILDNEIKRIHRLLLLSKISGVVKKSFVGKMMILQMKRINNLIKKK